ncbi:Ubiquitin domain-containing protein DSK2b [Hibiscus syriacus]|uniref:Ubiquitin domain-containing protein DSK2b n=1 Tax=Hibiscus syriacus TaxID=106335 RepID=A0A6A2WE72_HIBSY|nr:Ubiquitin domain-containing protein DSK2b [Hibiscus syriacus]
MVRGFAPSSSAPPPAATTNVAADNNAPGVTRGIGSNEGAGLGASLFPGLGPLGGGGGGFVLICLNLDFLNLNKGTQTNATARPNTVADARTPGVGGLRSLGLPDLPPMMNGMPYASQLTRLLQSPAISQMMQSIMSNPQYMNQIMNLNPQLRSMFDLNPQLREMMQNPEVLRQMFSPETMQQMLALQQSLMSLNRQQATQDSAQTGGTTAAPGAANLDLLMNMFGGLDAGGLGVPNQPDVPPEEVYATQLSQLQELGFYDTQENIIALRATSGNVHVAVERLLGNPGQ